MNYELRVKKIVIASLFILASCFLIHTSIASAQTKPPGISVTPSIIHLDLATDPPQYLLTYENNTTYEVTLTFSAKDFTELEDGYKLQFLEGKDAQNYKYSLSSWITFENSSIRLSPKEKKSVTVFIDNNRITKGGHYASILAQVSSETQSGKINLKAILSSLVFVRASTGKEIEEGKIASFKPLQDGLQYPEAFRLRFENSGNVHVVPYGLVQVYDPLNNLVAKGILNEDSLDALPQSIRNYDIKTKNSGPILTPGNYKAKIYIHFGKTNQKLYKEISFFSLGSLDLGKIILLLGAFAALLILRRRLNRLKP